MGHYPKAANGLHAMFNGQIITILGAVLFFIPLVGAALANEVLALVGGVMYLLFLGRAWRLL